MSDELAKACAPWENGSIEIPDWDSPLHMVFQAGISYALQRVGAAVGAKSWEGGDGTETIEGDVHVEICNILKAADMFEDEAATFAKHSDLTTLRARLAQLESILAEAREAVQWYGEQSRLARLIHQEGDAGRHALAADGGKRAATVSAKIVAMDAEQENGK